MEASRMKVVYVVSERHGRACLGRIGVAFVDSDGALNVKLEALPVSGQLRIVDYAPRAAVAAVASQPPGERESRRPLA